MRGEKYYRHIYTYYEQRVDADGTGEVVDCKVFYVRRRNDSELRQSNGSNPLNVEADDTFEAADIVFDGDRLPSKPDFDRFGIVGVADVPGSIPQNDSVPTVGGTQSTTTSNRIANQQSDHQRNADALVRPRECSGVNRVPVVSFIPLLNSVIFASFFL